MDSPVFYILLFIHLTSLIVAFGAVMVTDHLGLHWMRNRMPFERLIKVAGTTQRLIWIGWTGLVLTGIPMLLLKGEVDRLMVIKLFFVLLAGLNGYALHLVLGGIKRFQDADTVPTLLMIRLGLALAVSQVAWWGAFTIGFLHRHVWSVIDWPPAPWLWISIFVAVVLGLWLAAEWVLREHPSQVKVESEDRARRIERGPGPTVDPLGKED
jgi:hypothetical protein